MSDKSATQPKNSKMSNGHRKVENCIGKVRVLLYNSMSGDSLMILFVVSE